MASYGLKGTYLAEKVVGGSVRPCRRASSLMLSFNFFLLGLGTLSEEVKVGSEEGGGLFCSVLMLAWTLRELHLRSLRSPKSEILLQFLHPIDPEGRTSWDLTKEEEETAWLRNEDAMDPSKEEQGTKV